MKWITVDALAPYDAGDYVSIGDRVYKVLHVGCPQSGLKHVYMRRTFFTTLRDAWQWLRDRLPA